VLTNTPPEQLHALRPEIYTAGVEALEVADSNPDVRSVVIVGEGAAFCAGGNLQRLLDNRQKPPEYQARSIEQGLHSWIEAIRTFPKPVIAAVEGPAAGAGFSLALACDFIVAADNAVFVMAYSNVGLSPDGGASWSLARALPRPMVNELLMCGERIGALRLHQLGLVNRITGPGAALHEALALARQLDERPPNVMASIKELVNDAPSSSLVQQLASERDHFVNNLHHANAGIGIAAFLAKKPPSYP
jgi:enoyl-CoA hydratase/carnithine racemase